MSLMDIFRPSSEKRNKYYYYEFWYIKVATGMHYWHVWGQTRLNHYLIMKLIRYLLKLIPCSFVSSSFSLQQSKDVNGAYPSVFLLKLLISREKKMRGTYYNTVFLYVSTIFYRMLMEDASTNHCSKQKADRAVWNEFWAYVNNSLIGIDWSNFLAEGVSTNLFTTRHEPYTLRYML